MTKGIFKKRQKKQGLDARIERLICTGLIVSERVCKELDPIFEEDFFCADFTRWTATKALDFWRSHREPSKRHIQDVYHREKKNGMESSLASTVNDFLSGISSEFERDDGFNEGYVVEQAMRYFRLRSLKITTDDANALLEDGRIEDAETVWSQHRKIERTIGEGVNPFVDIDLIDRAFERMSKPMFTLPGAAGKLLSVQLHRKNFISFRGVVGRGKTFTLQELAKFAARARLNVAFIGVGDMSEEEYALRWAENLAGRSSDPDDCDAMWIPCLDCWLNQTDQCKKRQRKSTVGLPRDLLDAEFPHPDDAPDNYKPCSVCQDDPKFRGAAWWYWREAVDPLTRSEAVKLGKRFMKRMKGRDFKLQCFPSKGVSPSGLDSLLQRWSDYDDWLADVLIVDYMDELASDDAFDQFRHQEAGKWSAMRGLAFKWNILAIAADQGDANSYETETINLKNFNEDRRRNDVLTGGIGINQTDVEKARGIARWAYFKLRKGHYTISDQVCIVQALGQGRPLVGSWWRKRQG